ncbi:cell surface protein [Bifidobacterium sp. SMA15]|uniref:Cell surface protein n=1 Tax=Bifidobacterium platyrrhinorum TaxID=2661628 RepID=A0A6L9SP49_9BIFI|nr:cell surface protein [Bifidobacterium platyrrhinorum]
MALCGAGVAGLNLAAIMRFNQATASLNENLKTAGKADADLDALSAGQQQTDAQFKDAGALGFLLVPQVRRSIESNAEVSRKLTSRTVKEVARQKGTDGSGSSSASGSGTASGSSRNAKQGGGLTAKQKQQVEELLKANQQSTPSNGDTKQRNTTKDQSTKSQTTKPW